MAALSPEPQCYIQSILDSDLYKFRQAPSSLSRPAFTHSLPSFSPPPPTACPSPPPDEPPSCLRATRLTPTTLTRPRQYAILELYPDVDVKYRFTNRGGTRFTRDMHADVLKAIHRASPFPRHSCLPHPQSSHPLRSTDLGTLSLTASERSFLERRCPYFPASYLDYLSSFRFRPETQVRLTFVPSSDPTADDGTEWGSFELEVEGKWVDTILYEVPLMSIISEAYFTHVDTKWDYVGQLGASSSLPRSPRPPILSPPRVSSLLSPPNPLSHPPNPPPQSKPTAKASPSSAQAASSPSSARAVAGRTARTTLSCEGSCAPRTSVRARTGRRGRGRGRERGASWRGLRTCTLRTSTTWCRSGRCVASSRLLTPCGRGYLDGSRGADGPPSSLLPRREGRPF